MSSAPVPPEPQPRLADQPFDEIALRLLDHLWIKKAGNAKLREDLAELGHQLSPHELSQVYQFLAATTSEEGLAQVRVVAPMWSQLHAGGGAVFTRETLFDGTTLFRSAVEAAQRPALVCFTGKESGMLMPNVRFLELLGKHPVDVVMNTTESGTFGMWNLGGCGSFAGSLKLLKAALAERRIIPGAYAGASAGCGPALYAATLDEGTSAVMFGCRFFVPGRYIPLSQAGPAFEPICDCWQGKMPRAYNIFGALQPIDVENDQRFRALVPGARSYPLPNDDTHNPMGTLTARRKLRSVIDLMVRVAEGATVSFDLAVKP